MDKDLVRSVDVWFRVWATPVAKPRMTQRDKFYPSAAAQRYYKWKRQVQYAAKRANPYFDPWEGPIVFGAIFLMPIPNSWPKWKREAALKDEIVPTGKPDLSNLVKGVEDALQGIFYKADSCIYGYREPTVKLYAPDAEAGVQISLILEEQNLRSNVIPFDPIIHHAGSEKK